jgi:dienelactone hydrolase
MRLPVLPLWFCLSLAAAVVQAQHLPGTQLLSPPADPAAEMVAGLDRYLDRHRATLAPLRATAWSNAPATNRESLRARLRELHGIIDPRTPSALRYLGNPVTNSVGVPSLALAQGSGYQVYAVAWDVFRGVHGEGLLLVPDKPPVADVIAVPDCDVTPEQIAGLAPGIVEDNQFARRLAANGCRVLVPALVDRGNRFAGNPGVRSVKHSQRETLWRAAYELGRHPLGYEAQRVLAGADALGTPKATPLLLVGHGEGGLIAQIAGAADDRFQAVAIAGSFGLTQRQPELPVYRNVWALLHTFTDAEMAALIAPRRVLVEHGRYPEVTHTDAGGAAPGKLWRPESAAFDAEFGLLESLAGPSVRALRPGPDAALGEETIRALLTAAPGSVPAVKPLGVAPARNGSNTLPDPDARTLRLYRELLDDTQWLLREAQYTRADFWKTANFKSVAEFTNSTAPFRDRFRREVTGEIPKPSLAPNPRSRLLYETNGIRGYEVQLDVHPDVFAWGTLILPAGMKPGERRAVIVCQHGLEGRPRDAADPWVDHWAYHRYAYRLAEQGYITFSPQNPYIGETKFRQVLRKAQPAGLTLWSFIVRQHEVITDWLAAREDVDPARIAFYGLSYGGKTAMRVPVLVDRYCLSICSADYNEWIWKVASARAPYSYLWNSEYDMPEWNLGNTFNYAELSWLIFPRPFMVERGHEDGVAPDEWVAYEFARTRRHYVKMGLADRTEIEFFDGPHTIHGVGTFDFLRKHLK